MFWINFVLESLKAFVISLMAFSSKRFESMKIVSITVDSIIIFSFSSSDSCFFELLAMELFFFFILLLSFDTIFEFPFPFVSFANVIFASVFFIISCISTLGVS